MLLHMRGAYRGNGRTRREPNCNVRVIRARSNWPIMTARHGLEEVSRLDPVTTALQLGFYVLFGVSVWQYIKRRRQLELSVVAIFGSIAALFLLSFLNALVPQISLVARPAL